MRGVLAIVFSIVVRGDRFVPAVTALIEFSRT
jgi:hypothetical protein